MSLVYRILDCFRGILNSGQNLDSSFQYPIADDRVYADDELDKMALWREKGDPKAEAVVKQIIDKNMAYQESLLKCFDALICNDSVLPNDAPSVLKDYFAEPEFSDKPLDQQKLQLAQSLFSDLGPEIVLTLFCKSLPFCYACGLGAQVLTKTGRMTGNQDSQYKRLNRRVMETAQFVINVLAPSGFAPDGRAISTTKKIRLIHAAVRAFILESGWDSSELGLPINQEDMAGTLMSFSYIIIEGLVSLGLLCEDDPADRDKIEAYIYLWNAVGLVLGVEPSHLPKDYLDARRLAYSVFKRQVRESPAGQDLTASLVGYMQYMIPGKWCDKFPVVMIRYFMGDEIADMLNVQKIRSPWWQVAVPLSRKLFDDIEDLEDRSATFRKLSEKMSRKLLQSVVLYHNDYKQVDFDIPPSLKDDWSLTGSE